MKRFISKLIIIFLLLVIINLLYIRTNYWKSENNVNKFDDVPYNLELGNVGSSHGLWDFKYDSVPQIKAFNFALSSQAYYYDLQLLKKYFDHFEKNGVVLILISYFDITRFPDYSMHRSRYYRILPKSSLDSWSLYEYICFKVFPIFSAKQKLLKIFHDIPVEVMSPYYNRTTYMDEKSLYKFCVKEHQRWTTPEAEGGRESYEMNLSEVSKMIDFCYAHELTPVLVTTPVTDVLNEIYEKDIDFFPTFEQFSKDLLNKYPGLIYLDYSRDEYFSKKHELFFDSDHLNNMGADEFTRTVIQDLQEKGVILKK